MKIVAFGDFLLHLSPKQNERFSQADSFKISYTGAEENVLAALGLWGKDTAFITRLPENDLAYRGVRTLKSFGINTDFIAYGGERMGTYYLEKGASIRNSKVIYDRMYSAFTTSKISDYDFECALKDADILYISGITAYLCDNLYECVTELCRIAAKSGVKVFYDINYRSTLCDTAKAAEITESLAPYIHTLIGNEEHIKMLFSISSDYGEKEIEKRINDIAAKTADKLKIENVAVTVRRTISASDNTVYAGFLQDNRFAASKPISIHIVDRVGAGDAFSAGIVYGYTEKLSTEDTLNFAISASALKHTIDGDINMLSVDEIRAFMQGNSWDVKR